MVCRTLSLLACVLATVTPSLAQIQAGRIGGSVFDPNKAVVPGATVTVTNKATNVARRVTTSDVGGYVVPALDPGDYDVTAEMQVGKDLLLDIDLVLGETSVL